MRVRIIIEADLSGKCGRERIAELTTVADLAMRRHDNGPMIVHHTKAWWEDITPPTEGKTP